MKRWKKTVAALMIVSLLLSLFCVCALYFHPLHSHENNAKRCVFCAIAEHATTLLQQTGATGSTGLKLLELLCLCAVAIVGLRQNTVWKPSPIELKTKLLN